MKKYVYAYLILFLSLIVLHVTKGISFGITIFRTDHARTPDGKYGTLMLLVYNIGIMMICLIGAIVLTIIKENKIRYKWFIPAIMLIYLAFLPIVMTEENGGIKPQYVRRYWSCISGVPTNIPGLSE